MNLSIANLFLRSRRAAFLVACWAAAAAAQILQAATWADRLGFPADRKVVILHAHELGMCYETNAGVSQLLEAGLVRSASAMAPCPWFADAAEWRRDHADADVGLELTLNSELDHYRWKPASVGDLAPSLRDAEGFLWRSPIQTMVNASAEDVEHEVLAQIERAERAGLTPTHLTTHLGALITRPDLIEVYLRTARERWIPAVVVELTPAHVARFEEQGFPLPDDIIELVSSYPLPKVDDLRHIPETETFEQKKEQVLALLDGLKAGITQIAFRPAVASDALPRITEDWQQRVWDAQLFQDPDVAAALRAREIIVTDWKELMRRFEGAADEPQADADSNDEVAK
jgi:predicted glycoside hydrolase/deacetylase ChbG (UPF0249 family)